jgi:undecaprenyl-diphosphatase
MILMIDKTKKLWIINIISLILFLIVALSVYFNNLLFSGIDNYINILMEGLQNEFFILISFAFDSIFGTGVVIAISVLVVIILEFILNDKKDTRLFGGLMIISAGLLFLLKELIRQARPENALIKEIGDYAFPSGHTTIAVVLFGFLIYMSYKYLKSNNQNIIITLISTILIILVALSRLYINVHWFSDVLGGIFLGLFILSGGILFFERVVKK